MTTIMMVMPFALTIIIAIIITIILTLVESQTYQDSKSEALTVSSPHAALSCNKYACSAFTFYESADRL